MREECLIGPVVPEGEGVLLATGMRDLGPWGQPHRPPGTQVYESGSHLPIIHPLEAPASQRDAGHDPDRIACATVHFHIDEEVTVRVRILDTE